jgi:hypothetical protein
MQQTIPASTFGAQRGVGALSLRCSRGDNGHRPKGPTERIYPTADLNPCS